MMAESTRRSNGPPRWALRMSAPLALSLAGRRWIPLWAIIYHRGRRSGTFYETPIALVPTVADDMFLIGLPWGMDTNWARNVVADGGAVLQWKGTIHRATDPRLVGPEEAAALVEPRFRRVVGRFPGAIVLRRA
jgi:deazaflavin-dependent oxidoreductase (nitroreductase family)